MKQEGSLSVILGPFIILSISYFIYFIRYPMWQYYTSIEPIFFIIILSYFIILIATIFLLKKDSKKNLSKILKNNRILMVMVGVIFALMYLGLWYLLNFLLGSNFKFTSSTILRDYGAYSFSSFSLAFALYLGFSVFGAFVEEVVYRGYVQTQISLKHGYFVGIIVSALFFSFQHIHVFHVSWLIQFFQKQFFHVLLFGFFSGYLFLKSEENIWSVFSMHALTNAFSVSVPVILIPKYEFTYYFAETLSFIILTLLLSFLPLEKYSEKSINSR